MVYDHQNCDIQVLASRTKPQLSVFNSKLGVPYETCSGFKLRAQSMVLVWTARFGGNDCFAKNIAWVNQHLSNVIIFYFIFLNDI